ncbi:MAG TPA: hypothetical protein V6D09_00290 [Leptolyngbyaceae cyanobacterium]
MICQLRQAIVDGKPEIQLVGEVECDEAYLNAGHKGNPEAVKKKAHWTAQPPQRVSLFAALSKKRSRPGIEMIQRGGEVVIRMKR